MGIKSLSFGAESKPEVDEESEDFALFTHNAGELHCPDRELRHPCVKELRNFVENNSNKVLKDEALDCVRNVLETSNDFWVLKNMTHLLLDLDTNKHVFDKESRDNEFVMAGIDFGKKLMKHEECLEEFDTKSPLQCRCVPLYGKLTTLKLKNAKREGEAKEIFDELKALNWEG